MARAIWSGSISFGLVNVPVKAYTATRDHEVRFHQLTKTGARIRYDKVSEKTGKKVDSDQIVMGYELGSGKHVTFEKDELSELKPESTRTVDVSDFVALADIDPIYYERTYWLGPDGEGATRAYRLLLAAMEDRERVGIGTVVMRNKQYLAAIRPLDGALAMSTMRFADEVVPRSEIDALPSRRSKLDSKAVRLAAQIIDSLASEWDPKRYHDTYTEELKRIIERKDKAKGKKDVVETEEPKQEAEVLDLMAALEASVSRARAGRTSKRRATKTAPRKKATPRKKAAARKAPARKSA